MALSYPMPNVKFSWDNPPVIPKGPEQRKFPRTVEYRKGGSVTEILGVLSREASVQVNAAPGAGKSLVLPKLLAANYAVIHVLPYPGLAAVIAGAPKSAACRTEVQYCEVVDERELAVGRVQVTSCAGFLAWLLSGNLPNMRGALIYLDEAHSSDAYSYVLRHVTHAIDCGAHVLHASASLAGARSLSVEAVGEVKDLPFPELKSSIPLATDVGKPWSWGNTKGGIAIFSDVAQDTERIAASYRAAGCTVAKLDGRTPAQYIERQLGCSRLAAADGLPFVLLLDSTFRAGYTLHAHTIVDMSRVLVRGESTDGQPLISYRTINRVEKFQTRHRIARIPNQVGSYCWTGELPDDKTIRIDGVDVDVAAVLLRALGFPLPSDILSSPFAKGPVPDELIKCINGEVYFRHLPKPALVSPSKVKSKVAIPNTDKSWVDDLFNMEVPRVQELSPERMYDFPMFVTDDTSDVFPRGLRDVDSYLLMIVKKDYEKIALLDDKSARIVATHACRRRVTAQVRVRVIRQTVEANRGISIAPGNTKYLEMMRSEYSRSMAEIQYYFKVLVQLTYMGYSFGLLATTDQEEIVQSWKKYYDPMSSKFVDAPAVARPSVSAGYLPSDAVSGSSSSSGSTATDPGGGKIVERPVRGRWKRDGAYRMTFVYD